MSLEDVEKINKLARSLKENGLAASMDDAIKTATRILGTKLPVQEQSGHKEDELLESEKPLNEMISNNPRDGKKDENTTIGDEDHQQQNEIGVEETAESSENHEIIKEEKRSVTNLMDHGDS